jgi:hypothetical protein
MKNEREIIQLWSAATLYWRLVPSGLSANSLAMTISQWEKVCHKWIHPKLTRELEFTAHLASCAIRLYSIDEIGKYSRYIDYHDWWNNRQKGRKFFTVQNTRKIIHCVLRNLVAHDEHKCKDQKDKRSYRELKRYYFRLTFHQIYDGIFSVSEAIRCDLDKAGLSLKGWRIVK